MPDPHSAHQQATGPACYTDPTDAHYARSAQALRRLDDQFAALRRLADIDIEAEDLIDTPLILSPREALAVMAMLRGGLGLTPAPRPQVQTLPAVNGLSTTASN